MNHCEDFQALLDLFVDGELAPDEMARVREHLSVCPACRSYVDDVLAIRAAFPDVDDTQVPEDFAEGVLERIRADAPKQVKVNFRRRWMGAAAALAACCAVVVLLRSGPVGMSNMNGTASVTASDSAQQTESVYDTAAENNNDEESVESTADMDSGGAAEEQGTVHYTTGTVPENAPVSGAGDPSVGMMLEDESKYRNASVGDYKEDMDAGVETFADLPSVAGTASTAGDWVPVEAVNGSAAEDRAETEAPMMPFAPAAESAPAEEPEPAPAPAATSVTASGKTEEPDLVLSSSEAGDLLDAFVPAEERGTERVYLLTREEFAALLEELPVEYEWENSKELMMVLVTAA